MRNCSHTVQFSVCARYVLRYGIFFFYFFIFFFIFFIFEYFLYILKELHTEHTVIFQKNFFEMLLKKRLGKYGMHGMRTVNKLLKRFWKTPVFCVSRTFCSF